MRKTTALWMLIFALLAAIPAYAGEGAVQDAFYEAHQAECRAEGRAYYANAPKGRVSILTQPGGTELAAAANGTELAVDVIYRGTGGSWGLVKYNTADGQKGWLSWQTDRAQGVGWVGMDALLLIYDTQSFDEEHAGEFRNDAGNDASVLTGTDQRVIVWTYPGSGEIVRNFETLSPENGSMTADKFWTDAEGRVWGKISPYAGASGWVCLTDPGNAALPVTERIYSLYPAAHNEAGAGEAPSAPAAGSGSAAGSASSVSSAQTVPATAAPTVTHASAQASPAQTWDSALGALWLGIAAVSGLAALWLFAGLRKKDGEEQR